MFSSNEGRKHVRNRAFITLPKATELTVRQYFDGVLGRPYDEKSYDALARFWRVASISYCIETSFPA